MVVAAMDGMRTVDQIWQEVGVDLAEEAPSQNDVIHLLAELNAADLLQTEAVPEAAELEKRAAHLPVTCLRHRFLSIPGLEILRARSGVPLGGRRVGLRR